MVLREWKLRSRKRDISTLNPFAKHERCEICSLAKQTKTLFPLSNKRFVEPFDLIHCDIWGKFYIASLSGAHYFLAIVYDFPCCTLIFIMQHKNINQ